MMRRQIIQGVALGLLLATHFFGCAKLPSERAAEQAGSDQRPHFVFLPPYAREGQPLLFTVKLSWPSQYKITANYNTEDGTATVANNDYVPASGTVTFLPGETEKTIQVDTVLDGNPEPLETMYLHLTSGENYFTPSDIRVIGHILDAGDPTVTVGPASAVEGSPITFNVNLSGPSVKTITVNYATSNGTATLADSDYTAASGTLTFLPGQTTQQIIVNTTDDTKVEPDETLNVTLSGGSNYTVAGSTLTATGTIIDNDSLPSITINPASATEGSPLSFTVTLSRPYENNVTVDYASSDGTATVADSDYTAVSGTLTFLPGQLTKTITVNSIQDTNYEADEQFSVTLSGGANYTVVGSTLTAAGTIFNDDSRPTLSVANVAAAEGSALTFTVTLSNRSYETITVDYATSDGTATLADSDYTAASGTLTFAPNDMSKTFTVNSTQDTNYEPDETFNVTLSGGSNYTVAGSTLTATGTIQNDDPAPTLSIANVSATEGNSLTFTATLSARSYQTVTVNYATSDGTATTADSDYTAASGTLTFAPGDLTKTITVNTTQDTNYELDETFTMTLSGGSNYTVAGSTLTATGTILNDDSKPTLSIANASATEGSAVTFTVTLSNRSYQTITVNYATSDGTATTADSDYTSTSGTLTFNPGVTSKTFTVSTTTDTKFEPDETFTVTLSGGSNYTAAGSTLTATGTILNNDSAPTLSIANVSATEGSALTFTVTLSAVSYQTITVNYATSNGTATLADSDYTAASGTLTFAPGDLTKTFTVNTTADTKYEPDETFNVTLSGGSNYTVAGSTLTATGTIQNDDPVPKISIGNATGQEGGNVVFTVTQTSLSYLSTTFDYATSNGTATGGAGTSADYTTTSGTGTIPAGSLTTTISVPATDDALDEGDETFTMTISNPANATINVASGTGTIQDTVVFFDLMSGALPADSTFARASTGSYYNASGNVTSAAANTARFDHDPTNCPAGVCAARGLLMEPASTNLLLNSESFDLWTLTNIRNIVVNNGDSASPDGVNSNAEVVRESNANAVHSASEAAAAVPAGALVHFTVYAKNSTVNARNYFAVTVGDATTTNFIRANFDLTGVNSPTTSSGGNGGGQLVAETKSVGGGWTRVRLSGVASTTATALTVTITLQNAFGGAFSYNGNNQSGINFWGAQLEQGVSVPTSYIPTTNATASRSADSLYVTSFTGFAGNYGDGSAWTMITDFTRPWYESATTSASKKAAELCTAATCASDRISQQIKTGTREWGNESYVGGVLQGGSLSGATAGVNNTIYQLGVVKSAGALTSYLNGAAETASGALSYPTPDILYIGGSSYAGSSLSGHLRKFTFRPRAVSNANMLILTND